MQLSGLIANKSAAARWVKNEKHIKMYFSILPSHISIVTFNMLMAYGPFSSLTLHHSM